MKTSSLILLSLLVLTLPATAQQRLYRYQCGGGKTFEASYSTDQALLALAGREAITLPQVRSASGARYSNGPITLFTKGMDAFIEEGNIRTYDACVGQAIQPHSQTPPRPTPAPTQPVRGLW